MRTSGSASRELCFGAKRIVTASQPERIATFDGCIKSCFARLLLQSTAVPSRFTRLAFSASLSMPSIMSLETSRRLAAFSGRGFAPAADGLCRDGLLDDPDLAHAGKPKKPLMRCDEFALLRG
jgi:hypothetical protein